MGKEKEIKKGAQLRSELHCHFVAKFKGTLHRAASLTEIQELDQKWTLMDIIIRDINSDLGAECRRGLDEEWGAS